jgi:hypothetical protein
MQATADSEAVALDVDRKNKAVAIDRAMGVSFDGYRAKVVAPWTRSRRR